MGASPWYSEMRHNVRMAWLIGIPGAIVAICTIGGLIVRAMNRSTQRRSGTDLPKLWVPPESPRAQKQRERRMVLADFADRTASNEARRRAWRGTAVTTALIGVALTIVGLVNGEPFLHAVPVGL